MPGMKPDEPTESAARRQSRRNMNADRFIGYGKERAEAVIGVTRDREKEKTAKEMQKKQIKKTRRAAKRQKQGNEHE